MEDVSEEADYIRPATTVSDKVRSLEKKLDYMAKEKETEKSLKKFRFPFKWHWKFKQAKAKANSDKALVLFFNKKNEIEAPVFMPIYSGNMIVYKNKAYEFDPRAIWRIKTKGYPMVYCIKEIDRKPINNKKGQLVFRDAAISNNDIEQIRMRGDSTESDEFLIKAALKAQTSKLEGKGNWLIGGIIIVALIGVVIWLVSSGKLG
jgi:hypothetical protein